MFWFWFWSASVHPQDTQAQGQTACGYGGVPTAPPQAPHPGQEAGLQRPRTRRRSHGTLATALNPTKVEHKQCWPTPRKDASDPRTDQRLAPDLSNLQFPREARFTTQLPEPPPGRVGQPPVTNCQRRREIRVEATTATNDPTRTVPAT